MKGLILILCVLFSFGLYAQNPSCPCQGEIQKFCSDVKAGPGAYKTCLESHKGELSKECQDHVGSCDCAKDCPMKKGKKKCKNKKQCPMIKTDEAKKTE